MSGWRALRASDDDEVVTLFEALNREDPGEDAVEPAHMRRTLDFLRRQPARGAVVVLEAGDRILGYALLIAFWSNELGGDCCTLDELYVAPEARGRGHGSALIQALTAGSPLWPREARAILLEVSPHNPRALSLYRRQGFRGTNTAMRIRTTPSPDGDPSRA